MISLVDCNNFFVSCERVFQPALEGNPVIILSNNDGCAISRSNEAKALGIKMGAPYFEIKDFCRKHNVHVFSSNYTLYGDMSRRVMSILKNFGVQQEIYSIDECFLDLSGISDLTDYGQKIRKTVKQWVGMPICLGIGETKVLAKFANYLSKKYLFLNGVCNLEELGEARVNRAMQITPVGEVWGIGRNLRRSLQDMQIKTVYDLKMANSRQVNKKFSVVVERIVHELNKVQLLDIGTFVEPNHQIISTRSFGSPVTTRDGLLSALTYHVEQAGRKMRLQGLFARQMVVFAHTSRFRGDYLRPSVNIVFPNPVDSFRYLAQSLDKALDKIYHPGILYKKAGVIITDMITGQYAPLDLFDDVTIKKDVLLSSVEGVKRKFGTAAITLGSANLSNEWLMKQNLMSKHYTTNIKDLLVVH